MVVFAECSPGRIAFRVEVVLVWRRNTQNKNIQQQPRTNSYPNDGMCLGQFLVLPLVKMARGTTSCAVFFICLFFSVCRLRSM